MAEDATVDDVIVRLNRLSLVKGEERSELLEQLTPALGANVQNVNMRKRMLDASLDSLFDCLNDTSDKEVELVCQVLLKIATYFDDGEIFEKYPMAFIRALENPTSLVKSTYLRIIGDSLRTKVGMTRLLANVNLLKSVVNCIHDDKLYVAKESMNILIALADDKLDCNIENLPLFQHPCDEWLQGIVKDKNEVVRLRVYDVMIKVGMKSQAHMNVLCRTNYLENLCNEVKSDDCLLQLNALELLSQLAEVPQGLRYLEEAHVISQLHDSLDLIAASPMANLLMHGTIKLFGAAAKNHSHDCLELYPKFKRYLTMMLTEDEVCDQILSIETLTHLCSNPKKKFELANKQNYGEIIHLFFNRVNPMIKSGNTDIRALGLKVLSDLCQLHEEILTEAEREEEMSVNESLFDMFDDKPLNLIIQYAKLPILEISLNAYRIFLALSNQPWALKRFINQPGFLEFLLDRKVVTDKEIVEMKYTLIKNASQVENIFPPDIMKRLQKYVKEGTYFTSRSVEVALEEME